MASLMVSGKDVALPPSFPGHWNAVGRVTPQTKLDSVTLQDGYLSTKESWGDCEFSFQARTPEGVGQVQIWAGIRGRDRDSRYIFGLRGGNNNDVYLARLATEGDDTFLGVAPLNFRPQPGTWYTLRAVTQGNRFQIFVNDEKVPRINVTDNSPVWQEGGVSLGGGWLPVEFRNVTVKDVPALEASNADVWRPPAIDHEALRTQQRAAYQPATIDKLGPDRTEVTLDGKWLFSPDQELPANTQPLASAYDDSKWHVMDVPAMWTPCLSWQYGETGFKLVDDLSASKGTCDGLFLAEQRRLNNYTFDWKKTSSAWYRHYINLPADIVGRHVELDFDAVAKISEVWVNGEKVGQHTGMFGELDCDLTSVIHPGKNVVAVHVVGIPAKAGGNQVMGVAVTVEVTASMLNSLPHGMFRDDASGIWQPVKLVVTSPVAVNDVFIRPRLDGADFDVELRNGGTVPAHAGISYKIQPAKEGTVLDASAQDTFLDVPPGGTATVTLSTPALKPNLWTPADPNLYQLDLQVRSGVTVVDRTSTEFGFRTFTTSKNRFLLNGKPYWLRGADHFPASLRPNDAVLARKFLELAKEGNVRVTRSHTVPMTETWLTAADEVGMGVSYEGTWPWLMLKGPPPDEKLLEVWKSEFASLLRKYRSHPSVLMWTVNNEMKFPAFDKKDPEMLKKKWAIVSDMIKTMRRIDPTRPIVADSSYVRKEVPTEYDDIIKPGGFDDGDVDDTHIYPGWYNPSFFHFFKGEFGAKMSPDRPLISQELSTGYARNDDGHPVRGYLFAHHTPQALIGDEAYENRDPTIYLNRLAFMTKELAETIRRADRDNAAGTMHFAYLTWFKDVWNADLIAPWQPYRGLQAALQPVLVSAELFGRHFYTGVDVHRRVCVVNDADDFSDLPAGSLTWEIQSDGQVLAQGSVPMASTPYYSNQWLDVDLKLPETLPAPRVDAQLVLKLEAGGRVASQNSYDIVIATPQWAAGGSFASSGTIEVFDPEHKADAALQGVNVGALASLDNLNQGAPRTLVLIDAQQVLVNPVSLAAIKQYVMAGGRVLILNAGKSLLAAFPDQITGYHATNSGEVATMHVPESPAFDGLEPLDMSWFELGQGHLPNACTGFYTIKRGRDDVTELADHCDIHGYLNNKADDLKAISGSPLVEVDLGKGMILASEMDLEAAPNDPIARRIVSNLLSMLQR